MTDEARTTAVEHPSAARLPPRNALREDVRRLLRNRLIRGQLPPGVRLNESLLAQELGVSRTPLREALLQLQQEGLVDWEYARGFIARPLSAEEVREVYPVLWTLEGLALRTAGNDALARVPRLRLLVGDLARATTELQARDLDNRFHALLTDCANRRLLDSIGQLKRASQRYWTVFLAGGRPPSDSVEQHTGVLDALVERGPGAAAIRLEQHWEAGRDLLLQRLGAPQGPPAGSGSLPS